MVLLYSWKQERPQCEHRSIPLNTNNNFAYFGLEVGCLAKPASSRDPCCQRGQSRKQMFIIKYCPQSIGFLYIPKELLKSFCFQI